MTDAGTSDAGKSDPRRSDAGRSEHPNAALVRRAHQSFRSGDMDAVRQIFDWDAIRWVVPGRSAVSGVDVGMEAVFANFGKCAELTNGTYDAVGFDYLGSDDHAVALAHLTAERDGERLELDEAVIFTVRAGKLVEAYHLAYDQDVWDKFFH